MFLDKGRLLHMGFAARNGFVREKAIWLDNIYI